MYLLSIMGEVVVEAGFAVSQISMAKRAVLTFESPTVLGFVFGYDKAEELVSNWMKDADEAVANFQFGLRRAGEKAWNVYAVFLAAINAGYAGSIRISAFEDALRAVRT